MRARDKGLATALVTLAAALALMMPAAVSDADGGGDVLFKKSFGGPATDMFLSVIEVPGGFVAVGYSENGSFGSGDWAGEKGGGRFDAIIVKYDHDGNVLWKKRFGGSGDDCYNSVAAVPGGFVAVGYASVFGNGDWTGVAGKGLNDAIAVMYDDDGEALWWKNFGGADRDAFQSVAAVPGGIVAVGESVAKSFGTGDWDGTAGNGGNDAIAVMFDGDGEVMWKRHFGGSGGDYYRSVAAVPGGVVAVGYSDGGSFGNGDWGGTAGNGGSDAIAVMYDGKGEVVWKRCFGGPASDQYWSVAAAPGGVVAVGYSDGGSFGNGDWGGTAGNGGSDAIAVMYDGDGDVVWRAAFGGPGGDYYWSVAAVTGGFVAAGYSEGGSFGKGGWSGTAGYGDADATAVKYDHGGNVVGKASFGGPGMDHYKSVAAAPGGFVAVGDSTEGSFGKGGWSGTAGKGGNDAIAVMHSDMVFVPVSDITGVPSSAAAGRPLSLTGGTAPSDATDKAIAWTLEDAGGTGATISGNTLSTRTEGAVVVKATVANGPSPGTPFTKEFTIEVTAQEDGGGLSGQAVIWVAVAALAVAVLVAAALYMRRGASKEGR